TVQFARGPGSRPAARGGSGRQAAPPGGPRLSPDDRPRPANEQAAGSSPSPAGTAGAVTGSESRQAPVWPALPSRLRVTSLLGLFAGFLACLVLLQALCPYRLERASNTALDHPLKIAAIGCFGVVSLAAIAAAFFILSGSLIACVLALLALMPPGVAGLAAV